MLHHQLKILMRFPLTVFSTDARLTVPIALKRSPGGFALEYDCNREAANARKAGG